MMKLCGSLSSASMVVILLVSLLVACGSQADPEAAKDVRLYQVLPVARKSKLVDAEGQGEVIALVNAGKKAHTISGWAVQTRAGRAVLPSVTLKSGQVLYLANDADYFKRYWNFAPHFEYGADTDKAVRNLKLPDQKAPILNDQGDVVRLLDGSGAPADLLAYGSVGNPPLPWTGPAVQLVSSFPIQPGNQVITRVRAGSGFLLEPRADSWSGGTPNEPRRVWFAGQSDFPVKTVTENVTVTAASAPDNAGSVLLKQVDGARRSIRLAGYQYTAAELTERLIAAVKRGVKVQVAVERNPGGADLFDSDKEAHAKLSAGGVEVLYYHKWDGDLSTRINPLHSKYAIFDDEALLIASGNWTNSVYSTDSSCGNREWVAVIEGSLEAVSLVREVWDYDVASGHPDIRRYDPGKDGPTQPDTYDPGPCFRYTPVKPTPLTVTGTAAVTRILAPDNTLDRESGFLGLLRGAGRELLISANYIQKWWGSATASENMTRYPQPYLQEIVAAARRGVEVKVLLDRRNVRPDGPRENHHVVQYLNDLAGQEHLKLEARLVNMDNTGIGRTYHNKSLIVDDAVVISSINGSENSFRYAREMALKVAGLPELTGYYRDLFLHDWEASQRPNFPWNVMAVPRTAGTFIDWSPNVELDVATYEVYYKPDAGSDWKLVAEVERPGYEDDTDRGTWGVVAVTRRGVRSNFALVNR